MSSLLNLVPFYYRWIALGLLLAALYATGYYRGGVGPREQRDAAVARFDAFAAQVRQIGENAQKTADAQKKSDQLRKEKVDAENKRIHDADIATIVRLRHDRDSAGAGNLPAAPSGSSRADLACFDRGEYQRAYGAFIAGIRGLADEGTANTIDLDTAKAWASGAR